MKPRDLSVYDFKEEDELNETCHTWSKLSNSKFDDVDDVSITTYHFPQHAASGSITQMKEFHAMEHIQVFAIDDDDDHGFGNDVLNGPQDSPEKAASIQSEVFYAVSEEILPQNCHLSGDNVKPKSSSLGIGTGTSCPFGISLENVHVTDISPSFIESPCSNASDEAGASDGCDTIQESSPSTSGSKQEEDTVPIDVLAHDQSVSGLDMEEMDTIILTDFVSYDHKYIPAYRIVFSNTSLKIETSTLEEEYMVSRLEWNIEDILGIESQWSSRAFTAKVKVRLLTKDAVQEENEHGMTGVEVLEFFVHDPHWPEKQEWIMSLYLRYQAVWSTGMNGKICEGGPSPLDDNESSSDPYIPNFENPFDEVVYPKGDADAVSISKRDVDLLEPDAFLNDTIIDFYIKYLQNEIPSSERHRFYFFNSFFFRKLADLDKHPSGVCDGKAAFQRVRKWTRKLNLFEKDYIFIPVNYSLHWSLIVICHPGEIAKFDDENVDESVKVPCVLHMDSIRGSHAGLKDLVQSYLLEEWKEKQKEVSQDTISKFLNLRFLYLEVPQQENCSDCGLFLLHYAELFIEEAPKNFSPFRINKLDSFLNPDWFMPGEASLKRVYIQRLIYELLEGCPLENSSHCNYDSRPATLVENNEKHNGDEIVSERVNPGKSWNPMHSQHVQGMDLLDMSLCTNVSNLGMRDLLERCHQYGQASSFGQPGCPTPPIGEEVAAVDHLAPSTLGQTELEPLDEVATVSCHIGYAPGDFHQGFQLNSKLSDQDPENSSSPSTNHSSADSEEMMIIEPEVQVAEFGQSKNPNMQKENIDSLTESYASASASSDMMETPAEDSQELAKIYGNNDLQESHIPYQEETKEPSHQEVEKIEDDEDNTAGINQVVEDSSSDSDEGQARKRIRLVTAGDGDNSELVTSLSKEVPV